MEICNVKAYCILDSRGLPTIEVLVEATDGLGCFKAAVPSGASTGSREACELRDGDKSKFRGKGVEKAIYNVNNVIGPVLINENKISVLDQKKLDTMMINMDGTENKTKMGANAILALSMVICRVAAAKKKVPLFQHINDLANSIYDNKVEPCMPYMFFNVLNGGKHADNVMVCQEIMFSVVSGTSNVAEMLERASTVFQCLKDNIKQISESTNVGDEGGFAPNITPEKGIELILKSAKDANVPNDVRIGFDFAASEFEVEGKPGTYDFNFKKKGDKKPKLMSEGELLNYYVDLLAKYKEIVSLEDPFSENSSTYFSKITEKVDRRQCQIVADDLTCTNTKVVERCVKNKEANSLLVKMNQIGTLTETFEACRTAKSAGWTLMVSHRSGETNDDFVSDLAVGLGAEAVKFGAPSRGERVAKYNRLQQIHSNSPHLKLSSYTFKGI